MFHLPEISSQNIGEFSVFKRKESLIICSPPIINEKMAQSLASFASLERLIGSHVDSAIDQWQTILMQQKQLCDLPQVASLVFPLEPLFKAAPEEHWLYQERVQLAMRPKLVNAEGWVTVCGWLAEELEKFLASFPPTDIFLYSLESKLKDFLHEERSAFLRTAFNKVQELKRQDSPEASYARQELVNMLINHKIILEEVMQGFQAILPDYPHFLHYFSWAQAMCSLLNYQTTFEPDLVGSWGKTQLLLQMLSYVSGISSSIQGARPQVSFAAAIRLALLLILEEYPIKKVQQMVDCWDDWPKSRHSKLANRLRRYFIHLSRQLKIDGAEKQGLFPNEELLFFIPRKTIFPDVFGDESAHELLICDGQTGQPKELTEAGYQLFCE